MRNRAIFLMIIAMSTVAISQMLPTPQAITDPKQVISRPDAEVEQGEQSLSLERLYMTRAVGSTAWSPDGKTIVFVTNITVRNNNWLVYTVGGWPREPAVIAHR